MNNPKQGVQQGDWAEVFNSRVREGWISETKRMVDAGYIRFFRKRGMEPPTISKSFGDIGETFDRKK